MTQPVARNVVFCDRHMAYVLGHETEAFGHVLCFVLNSVAYRMARSGGDESAAQEFFESITPFCCTLGQEFMEHLAEHLAARN